MTKVSERAVRDPVLRRGLNPLALFGVMFCIACGGPYGSEGLVPLAGPGLAVLSKLVMALLWGVPHALVTAELVSAIPKEGGSYQWYLAGMGPFWSFQVSWLEWLTWFFDSAIYPLLIAAYLLSFFFADAGQGATWAVCLVAIWSCTWLNLRGVKLVGNFSIILTVLILLPAAAIVVFGWPDNPFSVIKLLLPEGESWSGGLRYAVIWGIWSYSGFAGVAYAAEEIVEPKRNYPKILAIIVPFVVVVYVLPLLAGLAADPAWRSWGTAHFAQIGTAVGGAWLGGSVSVAAMLAMVALFNGEMLLLSRLPYAVARDGLLPHSMARLHPRFGTPQVLLIVVASLLSVVTYFMGFVDILVFSAVLDTPTYLFLFAMPFVLRWRRPLSRGSFKIPGGWLGLVLVALFPVVLSILVLVWAPWEHLLYALGLLAIGPVLYLFGMMCRRSEGHEPSLESLSEVAKDVGKKRSI